MIHITIPLPQSWYLKHILGLTFNFKLINNKLRHWNESEEETYQCFGIYHVL